MSKLETIVTLISTNYYIGDMVFIPNKVLVLVMVFIFGIVIAVISLLCIFIIKIIKGLNESNNDN